MKLKSVIDQKLPELLFESDNLNNTLNEVLELIDEYYSYDTSTYQCNNLWEVENFVNWLHSNEDDISVDLKRELSKKINKSVSCDVPEFDNQTFYIGKNSAIHIFSSIGSYYIFKQSILSNSNKDDFNNDIHECFPRIYFDTTVKASINSLNTNFNDIKVEIVHHLNKINEFNDIFLKLASDGKNNAQLGTSFKEFSGIDCSPQASRGSVSQLNRSFPKDSRSNESKQLCCELHTKFSTHNRDRERQDRIYFHPGDIEIKSGKSIVVHIGTHL